MEKDRIPEDLILRSVYLPVDIDRELGIRAREQNKTRNRLIREYVEAELRKEHVI